jgi:hypothetical protein
MVRNLWTTHARMTRTELPIFAASFFLPWTATNILYYSHFPWSIVMWNWQFAENLVWILVVRSKTCPTCNSRKKLHFNVNISDNYMLYLLQIVIRFDPDLFFQSGSVKNFGSSRFDLSSSQSNWNLSRSKSAGFENPDFSSSWRCYSM